ncbi:MAG: amino acid permease [Planctomycetia bacterium]|nr:amino acid permease [Planctomycetia bacterium]
MSTPEGAAGRGRSVRALRTAQVIIVGSVMFSFISYWRTAAVVLCDMASTAYYIGGIVEQAIGPAAPWFIIGVLLLAFAVGLVYIESCSMFVRGGVYRVVREALGTTPAKLAVSALIFDYILTGPISTVSAGQYIMGLLLDTIQLALEWADLGGTALIVHNEAARNFIKRWGAVVIACGITLYFYRQNLKGLHESSDKAMKIMIATAVMGVIMLAWCGTTLAVNGPANPEMPLTPQLDKKLTPDGLPKPDPATGRQLDPLGFLPHVLPASWIEHIRQPMHWLSFVGLIGIFIAFGHSILAMSGLETLAQVYREVESPKLPNFKKAAAIVFIFALVLTGTISFMAVLLIPDAVRMERYSDNLIGGLAMNVAGPLPARLLLNAFVTVVGFMILAGACNTSIIGANGVLNRVAEDGILPDWFRKPHQKYGTTHRILRVIVVLQLFTIIASRGEVYILGEAYAFGVVWSFVFQAISMVVLRFKDPRPREFKVPLNLRIGGVEIPIGLGLILFVLLTSAVLNFFTKEVATIGGLIFSSVFFCVFTIAERINARRRAGAHQHLEQFSPDTAEEVSSLSLGLEKPYRKLVAIRSTQNLFMLEKTLAETDPETTDVVVMTAKPLPSENLQTSWDDLDRYDQELMTAVVNLAERAGKEVTPVIVPTNNPLHAVVRTAKAIGAQEIIMGASNKYTADDQLEQIGFYWISLGGGAAPITIRLLNRARDMYLDLGGGNRIPKISERKARSVAELRAAGVGVDRVLLVYDGSAAGSDLFQGVLTMLDPQVALGLVALVPPGRDSHNGHHVVKQDEERAEQLGRDLQLHQLEGEPGPALAALARDQQYDLVILALPVQMPTDQGLPLPPWVDYLLRHTHGRVFLASPPVIPHEVVDTDQPVATEPPPASETAASSPSQNDTNQNS